MAARVAAAGLTESGAAAAPVTAGPKDTTTAARLADNTAWKERVRIALPPLIPPCAGCFR